MGTDGMTTEQLDTIYRIRAIVEAPAEAGTLMLSELVERIHQMRMTLAETADQHMVLNGMEVWVWDDLTWPAVLHRYRVVRASDDRCCRLAPLDGGRLKSACADDLYAREAAAREAGPPAVDEAMTDVEGGT